MLLAICSYVVHDFICINIHPILSNRLAMALLRILPSSFAKIIITLPPSLKKAGNVKLHEARTRQYQYSDLQVGRGKLNLNF